MLSRAERAVAIAKLARFRMLANKSAPFTVGFMASGNGDWQYLWLGIVATILYQLLTSVANCVSDQVEDAIDYPERTRLCQRVGYSTLTTVVIGATTGYLTVLCAMAARGVPADTLLILLLALAGSFGYSYLRLKAHPAGPPGLIGGVSAVFLWAGWHGSGSLLDEQSLSILPSVAALWIFGATLCGSKDVHDLKGDSLIGYESVYLKIVKGRHPLARVVTVVSLPYAFVLLCSAAGAESPSPWTLLLYPAAIGFARTLVRARTPDDGIVVREVGYVYWLLFMSAVLLSLEPTWDTVAVLAGSATIWSAATRWLHPDPTPMTQRHVSLGLRLAWGSAR